jgi:CBS domain containing-hemolysin-like protein
LGITLEQSAWAFPLLVQANLILLGLLVAAWNLGRPFEWMTLFEEAAFLLLDVVVFGLVIPNVLLTRTEGKWLLHWTGTLRNAVRIVFPLVAVSQFLHHVATLGSRAEEDLAEASPIENIEALMQAGEEEGLLEKEDRRLIQSVVQFGDKTVREVMTPRQQIVAVPAQTTLSQLRQMLATKRFTRIPVYNGDLDHIAGFVHSGDLFAVEEADLDRRTVHELVRPVTLVPETKRISELLDELKQKAQIAIVVDEYGSVAGLATVEDLVEEIVGEIRDEHEPMEVHPLGEGQFSVPGSMDLGRLQELFEVRLEDTGGATTVSGFVTDALGRVPAPGERLERDGLVFQVTESDGRRVTRLLVAGPQKSVPVPSDAQPELPFLSPGSKGETGRE